MPTQSHRILARLTAEAAPVALGSTTWRDVLTGLRISRAEARRRLAEATGAHAIGQAVLVGAANRNDPDGAGVLGRTERVRREST